MILAFSNWIFIPCNAIQEINLTLPNVNYFAADKGKSRFVKVFIEAGIILLAFVQNWAQFN